MVGAITSSTSVAFGGSASILCACSFASRASLLRFDCQYLIQLLFLEGQSHDNAASSQLLLHQLHRTIGGLDWSKSVVLEIQCTLEVATVLLDHRGCAVGLFGLVALPLDIIGIFGSGFINVPVGLFQIITSNLV